MAWDLPELGDASLADLRFQLYVDGGSQTLDDVQCEPAPEVAARCEAALPELGVGRYLLWVSVTARNSTVEASASASIRLRVEPRDAVDDTSPQSGPMTAAASTSVDDPSDLALLPDGRVLVGERAGRVRLVVDGVVASAPLLRLPDVVVGDGQGLLALAVDSDFALTRAVYVLYSAGAGLRVTRFTMTGDLLTAPAVVLDGLPAASRQPMGRMRIGPDRALYIALDDGGDAGRAIDAGQWSGKVLRLNLDGTTPRDQPAASPVLFAGVHRPLGLLWLGQPATLWVAEATSSPALRLHRVSADVRPPADSRVTAEVALTTAATAVASASSEAVMSDRTASSTIVVAAGTVTPHLVRLEVANGRVVASQRVAIDVGREPIRCLAVAPDGTVYVGTARAIIRFGW